MDLNDSARSMWKQDGALDHLGAPSWLTDEFLQTLMAAFEDAEFEIYAVGGCVRDTVLNRHVADVDLCTNARPDGTIRIIEALQFRGKPWKAIPTGIEHGTVTAVIPGSSYGYEITTFRSDIETDGRHAIVAFSDSMEEDAQRRDFTINAFYAGKDGHVKDVVGGSADLAARRIRFIGDPIKRIEEDYLRILRFFRFTATHGARNEGVDPDGLAACAMLADGLTQVSKERIGVEMCKLIMDIDPAPIIGSMEHTGVLLQVLPGASSTTLARLVDLEENYPTEGRMLPPRDLATRLASLGGEGLQDKFRLSNDVSRKIALVKKEAGAVTPPQELGFRYGGWDGVHMLLLRWASLLAPFDNDAIEAVWRGAQAKFPIAAADLMPAFTGKALGDRIRFLETEWINSDFELTKSELLDLP
ncbi:CCA tRNA nucleotidyltransferase [Octadecabacter sp.]|nr:CCA tRNA nucleotidyltransferase [Octadecabacter sp.]